jgi:hypothetical protein
MTVEEVQPTIPTMWDTVQHSEPVGLTSYIV